MSAPPTDFLARVGDECVWTVGGSSAIAGQYRGREAIVAFFRRLHELTAGTYRVELLWELDDGARGVAYYRARGSRPDGRAIDLDQAVVYHLDVSGRFEHVRALPFDRAVFDAFWA